MTTHPHTLILGAGAAGLAAARTLSAAGKRVLILEARDRVGGRILTIPASSSGGGFGTAVELGPEFIHGRPESTWNLIRALGLTAYDIPFDNFQRRSGRLVPIDDFDAELAKTMGGLAHLGPKDMSFAEYLRRHLRGRPLDASARLALSFVQGFDAADPDRISAKSLAEEQEGLGDVGEEPQFRLLGGYGALVDALLADLRPNLPRSRVQLQLSTIVTAIEWKRGHVTITASYRGKPIQLRAPRIIITLPLGVLQLPPESPGSVRFSPDIPTTRRAADKLASGPIVKAVLKFDEAFWESDAFIRAAKADKKLKDATMLQEPAAPFPTFWTTRPLRHPILTAWAGGPKALALSGKPRAAIIAAAIDSLAVIFHIPRPRIARHLQRAHLHDWPADPFARGAYSYALVGGSNAHAALAKPIASTLFFAGEATDSSGQASTVAGALASGNRAASQILNIRREP